MRAPVRIMRAPIPPRAYVYDLYNLGIAISEGIGVCKVVGAILEIVPSPIIGEAIAFPVGSCNDNGFSVKAPADGNIIRCPMVLLSHHDTS